MKKQEYIFHIKASSFPFNVNILTDNRDGINMRQFSYMRKGIFDQKLNSIMRIKNKQSHKICF